MTSESKPREAWRTAQLRVLWLGVLAPLVALPIYGLRFAASVAIGAAIAYANLALIARGVRAMLGENPAQAWKLAFVLKFSVAIAGLYLLFGRGLVQGLPLLLGLLTLPVGILLAQLSPASR
ncbi:MAG TPA: ATP synthase subunit I [Polyangiaceae bacterium]|jgi:hypothetical protein|nr:ATP synthase subunit I [Polyangiaceae bacterium]